MPRKLLEGCHGVQDLDADGLAEGVDGFADLGNKGAGFFFEFGGVAQNDAIGAPRSDTVHAAAGDGREAPKHFVAAHDGFVDGLFQS